MWFDLGSWKLINHLEHHQLKKVHCGEEHAFAKPEIGAVQPVYKTSKCRWVGKVGHFGRMWRLGWGIQCFESSETSISKLGRCLSPDGLCPAGNGTAQRQKELMDTRQSCRCLISQGGRGSVWSHTWGEVLEHQVECQDLFEVSFLFQVAAQVDGEWWQWLVIGFGMWGYQAGGSAVLSLWAESQGTERKTPNSFGSPSSPSPCSDLHVKVGRVWKLVEVHEDGKTTGIDTIHRICSVQFICKQHFGLTGPILVKALGIKIWIYHLWNWQHHCQTVFKKNEISSW